MAYIRNRNEELTGYQASAFVEDSIDFQNDFVMAYRVNETLEQRLAEYRGRGYVVHLMTGIAWGAYQDYLNGEWDGTDHWDEAQTDRDGNMILHGATSPYMVPTVAFADYLTEKLKAAVDLGVEAIHVEEPEFWDRGGYSEAFKREYALFYRESWKPAFTDLDTRYKTARLKQYLYKRTIDRVSSKLKEYALKKHGRVLRFYVPTHSLINYTQWKIVSPEGALAEIPAVDGFIAQVWTGTSREKNAFDGVIKERTFETAYLEYGVMQELVRGTGKKMWFLHDPIEDNPAFDWNDYRKNYFKTVTASLLHTQINSYEICPWPNRVFNGEYPKNSPDAEKIPPEYATLLNNSFQTLGDMERCEGKKSLRVGVLMSDSALFQRDYPDGFEGSEKKSTKYKTVVMTSLDEIAEFEQKLFPSDGENGDLFFRFVKSNALPSFYSLALPLLKYGMPVRPVLLENVRRYTGYLDGYDVLLLSYEFMKPEFPDVNNALAAWIRNGGQLIYVGDGSDPYHKISSWWNSGSANYASPAEHLFEMLGIEPLGEKNVFDVGRGQAAVFKKAPAKLCFSRAGADELREVFAGVLARKNRRWEHSNFLYEERGAYITAAVLDESVNGKPLVLTGLFADMFTPDFEIITEKILQPDENTLLFDLAKIGDEARIIGTSVRVLSMESHEGFIRLAVSGAGDFSARIRLRTPLRIAGVKAVHANGEAVEMSLEYDEKSKTALLSYESRAGKIEITLNQ